MTVFCLTCLPFWPVMTVGITSFAVHRFVLVFSAVSAEWGPIGRLTVMLETGTSGVVSKFVVVMPFLMFVLPSTMIRTPSPSSTSSSAGNSSPPCETRNAGPFIATGSVGVTAVAVPTSDPGATFAQLSGFSSNVFARHAFCSVVRRDGSTFGNVTSTDLMFPWPDACVIVVTRLAPFSLECFPLVDAVNAGLKDSPLQPSAWNGLDSPAWTAPNVEVSVVSVASAEQLVGFNRKPCLLTLTLSERIRSGTPLTIVGNVVSAVTRAVVWLILIVERVTTGPRLNGPATAGTLIDRPNGAPL